MHSLFDKPKIFYAIILCCCLISPGHTATPHHFYPNEGEQCYILPYGAIGFVSHLVTYYLMFTLSLGLRPLQPWKLNTNGYLNLVLSVMASAPALVIAIMAMAHCEGHWPYILLALSRLMLSLTLGILSLRAAITGCRKPRGLAVKLDSLEPTSMPFWMCLSLIGTIFVLCGTSSLLTNIIRTNRNAVVITATFASLAFVLMLSSVAFVCCKLTSKYQYSENKWPTDHLGYRFASSWLYTGVLACALVIASIDLFAASWSDWILGAISSRYSGIPANNNALYWCYFTCQLFPVLFTQPVGEKHDLTGNCSQARSISTGIPGIYSFGAIQRRI